MKAVLLGRASCGKSSLVERFAYDRWNPAINSTIGGSFCAKEVTIPSTTSSTSSKPATHTVTIGIWDTAGSERYESLTRHYFNQAESAFCCFDLTDRASWEKVAFWVNELKKVEPNCQVYIIGCKSDLLSPPPGAPRARLAGTSPSSARQRCVSLQEIELFCESLTPERGQYFETSALNGTGIQEAFAKCCQDWMAKPKKDYYNRGGMIRLDDREERKKKGMLQTCCNQ